MMDFKKNPKTDFKPVGKLNKEQARREIEALREAIEYHDYLYYVKDQPAISDETYDKLFRRLQELEEAFPEFASPNSPTQRVGGKPAAKLEKVRHTAPMLSLNAVYREKEAADFDRMVRREVGPSALNTSPSRSSMGFPSRSSMRRECSSAARRGAMARSAKTSPTTSRESVPSRCI